MLNIILLLIGFAFVPKDTIYDYSFKTIDGKKVSLSQFKGKKILIVNTASLWGWVIQIN